MNNSDTFVLKRMKALNIDQSRPIIFYGAGGYAPYIGNVLKKAGIEPVCFADKDEKKHGTLCCGKPILPLEQAIKQHPDFLLFITTIESSWKSIAEELFSSGLVAESQILNWQLLTYKSCARLENVLVTSDFFSDRYLNLYYCCMWSIKNRPQFNTGFDDYDEAVSSFFEFRDNIVEDLNSPSCQHCLDCPQIEEKSGMDIFNRTIRALHFSERGVCNFECSYCLCGNEKLLPADKRINYSLFLHSLEKQGMVDENTFIIIAVGEITLHPQCEEILSLVEKYNKVIVTNASVFNEKISSMIKCANTRLNVSLDAGTKETFLKIKRRNMFDKVCENLRRYASGGGNIELKYIILPDINDNMQDADGFLNICSEVNPSTVILSKNFMDLHLPEKTIKTGRYIISKAQELGFETCFSEYFTQDEISSMNI